MVCVGVAVVFVGVALAVVVDAVLCLGVVVVVVDVVPLVPLVSSDESALCASHVYRNTVQRYY